MTAFFEKTRFDVEEEITQLGNFSEMIKSYADMLYDGKWKQTEDDVHTTLHGFANLLMAHSEKMMDTHCKHYELNEYRPQPETTPEVDEFFVNVEKERGNWQDLKKEIV